MSKQAALDDPLKPLQLCVFLKSTGREALLRSRYEGGPAVL